MCDFCRSKTIKSTTKQANQNYLLFLKVLLESPYKVRFMQWEKIGDDLCLDMAEFYLRSKEAAKLKQMS